MELDVIQHLKAEAVNELERLTTLARILPFNYLEWLDNRAAALATLIRDYDQALSQSQRS